jgi:hypothetical protein
MSRGPSTLIRSDGTVSLLDPAMAVDELLAQRVRLAAEWGAALEGTADEHQQLLRDDLTKQLNAGLSKDSD